MGNPLAIASVTRVLKDLLNNGLIDYNVSDTLGTSILVTALPPDKVNDDPAAAQTNRLNLFLHQVTPNIGWRNSDLPTRDNGGRIANPLLALNLHYLLTAYGAEELHGEILLGYAMLLLHQNGILSRDAIRTALQVPSVSGAILPTAYQALAASELADQAELIKITPEGFDTDHTSKLWTAMQTHYRLTAAYEVSVVLIEGREPRRTPLPVLTRGAFDPALGREAGIAVQPGLVSPYPMLESVQPPHNQTVARTGETVTLLGHDLAGSPLAVRLSNPRSGQTLDLPPLAGATDSQMSFAVPPDPATCRAGIHTVAVVVGSGSTARVTNALPLILVPRIETMPAAMAPRAVLNPADGITTLTITCSPEVSSNQSISLIAGMQEIEAEPLQSPPANTIISTQTITFQATGFTLGQSLRLRLRVDGAESILIDRSASPPVFDATQMVTVT